MPATISSSVAGPVIINSEDSPLTITSCTGSVTSTGPGDDGIDQGNVGIVQIVNAGEIGSSYGTGVSGRVGFVTNTGSISRCRLHNR